METRLGLLSQSLVEKLSHTDEKKLRDIAWSTCKMALAHTRLSDSRIDQFINVTEGLIEVEILPLRQGLLNYVEKLDEIQWNLREEVDKGNETMSSYLQAFTDARVMNALYFALNPVPFLAAAESIYETFAATNDLKSLEELVSKIMG